MSVEPMSRSQIKPLRKRSRRIPWFRRYGFLLVTLAALVAYALFLLPPSGRPATVGQWAAVGLFFLLALIWISNVLADASKPDLLKGSVAFGLIFLMGWLFYRDSGGRWEQLGQSFFNFQKMEDSWPILLGGLLITLQLALVSAVLSTAIGLFTAVLRSFNNKVLNLFIIAYIDLFRSIPMIVLMVLIFYALPYLGIELNATWAGTVALSLAYGAYAAESCRAGIESVRLGQVEASRALGLSTLQTMRLVILPQAFRVVIPPLTGNLVSMLKDTAIASVITSPELMKRGIEVYVWKANPTPLLAVAIVYMLVLLPAARLSSLLEQRMKARWVKTALK